MQMIECSFRNCDFGVVSEVSVSNINVETETPEDQY